jgi:hypothetical protein
MYVHLLYIVLYCKVKNPKQPPNSLKIADTRVMFFSRGTKNEQGPQEKSIHFDDKMKKNHSVGTIPNSNIKVVERRKTDTKMTAHFPA